MCVVIVGVVKGEDIRDFAIENEICCTFPLTTDDDIGLEPFIPSRSSSNRGSLRGRGRGSLRGRGRYNSSRGTFNNPHYQQGEDDKSLKPHFAYFEGRSRGSTATTQPEHEPRAPTSPPSEFPPPPEEDLDERDLATPIKFRRLNSVSFLLFLLS